MSSPAIFPICSRARVEIICISDMGQESVTEEEEIDLNDLSPEESDQIQEQLALVLEKVEKLEQETGICRDGILYDDLYREHSIKRKHMAQLVAILTSDGLISSVKPGYYKRVT